MSIKGLGREPPPGEVRMTKLRAADVQVLMDEDDVDEPAVSLSGQVHGDVPSTCREDRSVCVDTVSWHHADHLIATSARSLRPGALRRPNT